MSIPVLLVLNMLFWSSDHIKLVLLGNNQRRSPRDRGLGLGTTGDQNFAILVLTLVVLVSVSKDWSRLFSRPINNLLACMHRKIIPYILTYKPAIFGSILTFKLWGSAYTRVIPYSQSQQSAWRLSVSDAHCVCCTGRGPLVGNDGYVDA